MYNLIVFGAPGAGKGTQSKLIAKRYNLKHISTGELLRKEIKKESKNGILCKKLIDKGKFVPDRIVIEMVEKKLIKHRNKKEGFIFDGFPRTINQAKILDELLFKQGWKIEQAIHLMVPIEVITSRILERSKHESRTDDANKEIIEERVSQYRKKTEPVLDFYKKQHKYFRADGIGDIDSIFAGICETIDSYHFNE